MHAHADPAGQGGLVRTVRREAVRHPLRSGALVVLAGLMGLTNLAVPVFLERAIDAAAGLAAAEGLWPALGALALIGLGRGVVSWARDTVLRRLRRRRVAAIDRDLVHRAMHAERGALEPVGPGAAADAVASGDRIGAYLFGELPSVLAEAVTGLALLVLLWAYDWRMGVLGLALALWNARAIWRLAAREASLGAARAGAEAELARGLERGLTRLSAIRLGGLEPVALDAWTRAIDRRRTQLAAALARGEGAAASQLAVSGAAQAIVLSLGGLLIAGTPGFTIGDLFACSALIFALNDPARRLMQAHADASKATAELLRRAEVGGLVPWSQGPGPPDRTERARIVGADHAAWKRMAAERPGSVLVTGPTVLLPGTVAQNISLMGPVEPERLAHALRVACLDTELGARGLDTLLSAGIAELSTGQRQRLAIARAVYADAPAILIATGMDYLDRETAAAVLSRLRAEPAGLLLAESPLIAGLVPDLPVRWASP